MKKINVTNAVLQQYKSQTNVIRRSGNNRLNYGKIAIMTDFDPD